MSEIKHTPGPWIWADGYRGLYGAGKNNEVLDYATYEGMWLGHVNEQKANALLIAAAPELLEAVEAMLEWDAREEDQKVDFRERLALCGAAFDKARAAYAKATGA